MEIEQHPTNNSCCCYFPEVLFFPSLSWVFVSKTRQTCVQLQLTTIVRLDLKVSLRFQTKRAHQFLQTHPFSHGSPKQGTSDKRRAGRMIETEARAENRSRSAVCGIVLHKPIHDEWNDNQTHLIEEDGITCLSRLDAGQGLADVQASSRSCKGPNALGSHD